MLKEIDEQPAVMRKIVQAYTQGEKVTLDEALLEKLINVTEFTLLLVEQVIMQVGSENL